MMQAKAKSLITSILQPKLMGKMPYNYTGSGLLFFITNYQIKQYRALL